MDAIGTEVLRTERIAKPAVPRIAGIGFGLAATAAAVAVRLAAGPAADTFPLAIFLPAAVIATFVCGTTAGIVAAVGCGIACDAFLTETPGPLPRFPEGIVAMILYVGLVSVYITFIHRLATTSRRLEEAESRLRLANEGLEQRIAERTATLNLETAERRKAEERLRQSDRAESRGRMAAELAHDLNNLLGVAVSWIDVARSRAPGRRDIVEALDNASDGAMKASDMVADILGRPRRHPPRRERLDLGRAIREVAPLLEAAMAGRGVLDLTACVEGMEADVERSALERALVNLVVNASEASRRPTCTVTIATCRNEGSCVSIVVEDDGPGLDDETSAHAFDAFYTTKETTGIGGMGLHQVADFARRHGGTARFDPVIPNGARFTIRLTETPREDGATGPTAARSPRRMMVVDDERGSRKAIARTVALLSDEVVEALDAEEAIELLASWPASDPIDAVVCDIRMPGMGGTEMARLVARRHPGIPVLLVSGHVPGPEETSGFAFLAKPFSAKELSQALAPLLRTAAPER